MKIQFSIFFLLSAILSNAESYTVDIINFAYTPATLTINVGDQVTWTNHDVVEHTVTSGANCSQDDIFGSAWLEKNQTFTYTFNSPGDFPYFCIPHCHVGSVIVQQITGYEKEVLSETEIQVYPNPFSTQITIGTKFKEAGIFSMEITDSKGQLWVRTEDKLISTGESQLAYDMELAPKGIYFVKVIFNEKKYFLDKLIKY